MSLVEVISTLGWSKLLLFSSGGLIFLLTCIEIVPIKINPWSWLIKKIGKIANADVGDQIKQLNGKLDESNKRILIIEQKLEKVQSENEEYRARSCRSRMLQFGDEIYRNVPHSKEHFEQILIDADHYDNYCSAHPEFENNITEAAMARIKEVYQECLKKGSFI